MSMHTRSRAASIGRLFACSLLAALLLAAPALADREQVRKAMDQMEHAVLAGDKTAYLAQICKDDPCFAKEQENWAADFDRHRAAAFSLSINDERPADFAPDEARFTLVMAWSMGEELPRAQDRRVSYPVVFRLKDGKWLYAGEDWHVLEADGVDGAWGARALYLDDADVPAENVVAVLPEVRAHVDEGFENQIKRVQEVKLYRSMRHLQASIYLSYTDSLGGWNEPDEAIKVLEDACRSRRSAKALLAHEYGHCATFEYGPHSSKMPWWILEGVAELSAEFFRGGDRDAVQATVERWARRDNLAPWDEMADFHNCPKKWMGHVYTQGHHMVGYISDTWHRKGRNAWLRALAQGKTLDEATTEALGLSWSDLAKQWRASLPPADPKEPDAVAPEDKRE